MSESCSHDTLEVGSQIERLEGEGRRWLNARLSVRCSNCGTLFSWKGLNSGMPNASEPVVSADGYELRAPIVPQPGAAVGILMRAGLEDRLRHPLVVEQNQ